MEKSQKSQKIDRNPMGEYNYCIIQVAILFPSQLPYGYDSYLKRFRP